MKYFNLSEWPGVLKSVKGPHQILALGILAAVFVLTATVVLLPAEVRLLGLAGVLLLIALVTILSLKLPNRQSRVRTLTTSVPVSQTDQF